MGTQYLVDTNAVIELLGDKLPENGTEWLEKIIASQEHHLSVINQIELLGYNGSDDEMKVFEEFVSESSIMQLSEAIVKKTISLRKIYKIKLPDAIIAATALIHDLTVVTRNSQDFKKIPELSWVNPHDK